MPTLGLGLSLDSYIPVPSSDPDALAIVNKIISVGGSLSEAQQGGINTLFKGLKSQGIYASLAHMYLIAGGTEASHALDAINPEGTPITFSSSLDVTHDANGMSSNSSAYGDLGWAANSLTYASHHCSCYSRTAGGGAGPNLGVNTSPVYLFLALSNSGFLDFISGSIGARLNASSNSAAGFVSAGRHSTTGFRVFYNGVQSEADTVDGGFLPSENVWCFGYNVGGVLTGGNTKNIAFMSFGASLTPTQHADLYTLVQSYQTAMGRQV